MGMGCHAIGVSSYPVHVGIAFANDELSSLLSRPRPAPKRKHVRKCCFPTSRLEHPNPTFRIPCGSVPPDWRIRDPTNGEVEHARQGISFRPAVSWSKAVWSAWKAPARNWSGHGVSATVTTYSEVKCQRHNPKFTRLNAVRNSLP
jgi:hypothetical protein